jgi:SAM-dependent methyltransferase
LTSSIVSAFCACTVCAATTSAIVTSVLIADDGTLIRRVAELDQQKRTSFDAVAEQYDAVRPSYPAALIDDVLARSGARRALEVGAGTGKATVMFAERGLDIVAVEPGAQMAAVLRERVRGMRVEVVEAMFESCNLSNFALAYAATSFHWIEPRVRYVKAAEALRPGGALALFMNEKAPMDPAMRAQFDAAYAEHFGWPAWDPDYLAKTEAKWCGEIDASGRFGAVHVGRFAWQTTYTSEQFVRLLDTYSDHRVQPDDKRLPLYAAMRAAIDRNGGSVEIPYVTLLFFALRL